jgi:carboxymethylenebutenolidase
VNYLQQYLLDEFVDDYKARRMRRRDFIRRAVAVSGGVAAALPLLGTLGLGEADVAAAYAPDASPAPQERDPVTVSPADPAIRAGAVQFPAADGATLLGYLARPAAEGAFPAVVIVHENRGLTEHFRDVARRYAKEGFIALAIDLLSREGGTDNIDPAEAGGLQSAAGIQRHADDTVAAGAFLRRQPGVNPLAYGLTGFCFGGGVVWVAAAQDAAVAAAAPYYGPPPAPEVVARIRGPVLAIYGDQDRLSMAAPDLEAVLDGAGVRNEFVVYPGAMHAFFNDSLERYHPEASADAWPRTLAWFRAFLPAATRGK